MSDKYIIGIDPDSTAHGVASYDDGELLSLKSMSLIGIHLKLMQLRESIGLSCVEVHIEDVCANNAAFKKKGIANARAATAVNRSIGKCQQAQIELERLFDYFGIKVVKHKISKKWKDQHGKAEFERLTGWTGRSNEDTRSAAYFGFLGCK